MKDSIRERRYRLLIASFALLLACAPQTRGALDLSGSVVAGGGGTSAKGNLTLTGTIGQPVAATDFSGGKFSMQTGFWTAPSERLLNVSTRLRVLTGENVLIGGFIVTGTQSKKVILRAIGPSLAKAGLQGVLANPTLELHDSSGATIASNDNWKDSQQAAIQATQIAPSNDLESAIVATLPANNASYTAIVRGKDNGTGLGVVEAYDLDATANSKLGNISTRGFVETGNNVMIGGFILGGGAEGSAKVIVRAIGPSLKQSGIAEALADPTLELHNSSGALLAANDNWKDTQKAEIQATGIAPKHDLESAIVDTLVPGAYTAIVQGKGGTTGVAVVEVYNLTQ
jgi:hypothetical protein